MFLTPLLLVMTLHHVFMLLHHLALVTFRGGQTSDLGVESLLESEDENGVEVSDEVFGLLN